MIQDKSFWIVRICLLYIIFVASIAPLNDAIDNFATGFQYYEHWGQKMSGGTFGERGDRTWMEPKASVSVTAIAIMLLVELTPEVQTFFSSSIFQFLGEISFGLYLSHPIVLLTVLAPFTTVLFGVPWFAMIFFSLAVYVPVSLIMGYAFYLAIDLPSVKFSRWLINQLFAHNSSGGYQRLAESSVLFFESEESKYT